MNMSIPTPILTQAQEIESVARLAHATFARSRGFIWGDNRDFEWDNTPAGAKQAWRDVATAVLDYVRQPPQS